MKQTPTVQAVFYQIFFILLFFLNDQKNEFTKKGNVSAGRVL